MLPYDFYGAYAVDAQRRLGDGAADVAALEANPYLELIEGECTFGRPRSFEQVISGHASLQPRVLMANILVFVKC